MKKKNLSNARVITKYYFTLTFICYFGFFFFEPKARNLFGNYTLKGTASVQMVHFWI